MATPKGGAQTPVPQTSFWGRAAQAVRVAIQSVLPGAWFGPGQPLRPVAPPDTEVRSHDYAFASNTMVRPRSEEPGTSFEQLRAFADNYDILRLCIETRKDQVCKMPWQINLERLPDEKSSAYKKRQSADPRVLQVTNFFKAPDTQTNWQGWIRMLLEDVFVIDALTISPRRNVKGNLIGLSIVDGSTIKPLIDTQGRRPVYPDVAYQQILKGIPAVDLTARDLIYAPRNPRAHRIYGYGPVEQILMTINIALRRQITQLQHFTDGNIPEAIVSVSDTWSADEIERYQRMFDTLAGDTAETTRMRFIPKSENIIFPKEKMLSDLFDEWLARIVCYAFSLPPTAFTKTTNRATAEQTAESALSEGLLPLLEYIEGLMNHVIAYYIGWPDIKFAWQDQTEADPLKQAQINKIYVDAAILSVDEIREDLGEDPIGMGHAVMTATGPVMLAPFLSANLDEEDQPGDETDADAEVITGADPAEDAAPNAAPPAKQIVAGANEDSDAQKVFKSKKNDRDTPLARRLKAKQNASRKRSWRALSRKY